jgi:hypothetical protein
LRGQRGIETLETGVDSNLGVVLMQSLWSTTAQVLLNEDDETGTDDKNEKNGRKNSGEGIALILNRLSAGIQKSTSILMLIHLIFIHPPCHD